MPSAGARRLVDSVLGHVSRAQVRGESVRISGCGTTFGLRDKPARPGRNPKTGATVTISRRDFSCIVSCTDCRSWPGARAGRDRQAIGKRGGLDWRYRFPLRQKSGLGARVSTRDQDATGQEDRLAEAGAVRVLTDGASGARAKRPALAELIDQARPGNILCLDRLGRSLKELLAIVEGLKERGIHLARTSRRSPDLPD